jgi:hypothetical protein
MATAQDIMTLFNVNASQLQRAGTALGKSLKLTDAEGNTRSPTPNEFISWLKRQVRGVVLQIERRDAEAQISINVTEWD